MTGGRKINIAEQADFPHPRGLFFGLRGSPGQSERRAQSRMGARQEDCGHELSGAPEALRRIQADLAPEQVAPSQLANCGEEGQFRLIGMVLDLFQINLGQPIPIAHQPLDSGAVEETGEETVTRVSILKGRNAKR
jgi:hypothetical protein